MAIKLYPNFNYTNGNSLGSWRCEEDIFIYCRGMNNQYNYISAAYGIPAYPPPVFYTFNKVKEYLNDQA